MKVVKNFKELNGGDTCLRMNLQGKFLVKTDEKKKNEAKKVKICKTRCCVQVFSFNILLKSMCEKKMLL